MQCRSWKRWCLGWKIIWLVNFIMWSLGAVGSDLGEVNCWIDWKILHTNLNPIPYKYCNLHHRLAMVNIVCWKVVCTHTTFPTVLSVEISLVMWSKWWGLEFMSPMWTLSHTHIVDGGALLKELSHNLRATSFHRSPINKFGFFVSAPNLAHLKLGIEPLKKFIVFPPL